MVSQNGYHAHNSDGKRPSHSYSPYMTTNNRYGEDRVYVTNSDHRGLLGDPLERGEATTRKRIAVACGRCRQRKIRCSGDKGQNLPCTNCQSAGVTPCLFLRVSSREAAIKTEFEYNSNIARALAHRATVPLPPPPPMLSSSNTYGATPGDFSPGSSGGGGQGDPFRSTSSLYPYNHKSLYNSLPASPWTASYGADCSTPSDYSTPQPCSPYTVVNDQTSQLMPPFSWDGRNPAGPPPPPLMVKVQAPSTAPTLETAGLSSLPPPPSSPAQSHTVDQHQVERQSQPPISDSQDHCHCHHCFQTQAQVQVQAQAQAQAKSDARAQAQPAHSSSISVSTPKPHTGLGPVSSQGTDINQYIHGELVYRPALNGSDSGVGASSDYNHQQESSVHSVLTRASVESIGRLSGCGGIIDDGNGGSSSSSENAAQVMQATPMDRVPSHGSLRDQGVPMSMTRFKQEVVDSRSAAPSPTPIMSSVQSRPPSLYSSQKHAGNPSNTAYASGHASAGNSIRCLAQADYSTTSNSNDQSSSVAGQHSYGPKSIYHETSLYVGASSVGATPVSGRANEGSIFSDHERDVVGSQGPGPVTCLDSYTYDNGPSTKILLSSQSSPSLHGVYGKQNKKKSSTDSLIKTRPYSPAEGPMLSMSNCHSYGSTSHVGNSCHPDTSVCASSPPPPSHKQELDDVKAGPLCQAHTRR